ncbi:MAG: TIGR04282 family arsenosugar biosynthesis glycosyltransferase [Pyrinomonadaceae bacterium]|nr:TIGR04282 family arsenosugar biosynthesis glycosyltransferase [Pyrinomonadaceae bacterium]
MKRATIIMAKVPRAGNVKTRLQPFLSAEQCVLLSEAFLEDAINKAKGISEKLIIAFSPADERAYFDKFGDENLILTEQKGSDLGERMCNAFQFALSQNSDSAVMIGTDSPTFPADYIEQAFEFLELETDAVLGKTADGGFYLIGLRKLNKEIFENVAWSSGKTFEQTYRNIMKSDLHLREVPSWFDVDEKDDLLKLDEQFIFSRNAVRRAPKTFETLNRILR